LNGNSIYFLAGFLYAYALKKVIDFVFEVISECKKNGGEEDEH